MQMREDYKLIVKNRWRDFERLAFIAIKAELKEYNIVKETLTEAIKDGGFDGEYIISVENNILQILFEAKLRSDVSVDLELGQFAKSLVIAVTRFADAIYIVTNLHFSQHTLEQLTKFSSRSEIDIKLYNGYSIKQFIENSAEFPEDIDNELLEFLLRTNTVSSAQSINPEHMPIPSNSIISVEEKKEFSNINKSLRDNNQYFYVTGEPYVGKTFYINRLIQYLKQSRVNAHIIDVSKCLSYKDFFIKLLEKTFGIFFELIDILDDKNFEEAFEKIGIYNVSARDLHILKVIFSKKKIPEYDISVIFHFLCEFYSKLFYSRKGRKKFVIAFLNISQADSEIIKLLIFLLNSCKDFYCILEIAENEYRLDNNKLWEQEIKKQLQDINSNSFNSIEIKEYKLSDSIKIFNEKYSVFTRKQCKNILQKFGYFKRELYELIELIEISEVVAKTPLEMVYEEIINWEIQKQDAKIIKCLDELYFKNHYISYIYIFFNCLGGKVTFNFLETFPLIKSELEKCYFILKSTNLFHITSQYIYTNNEKILECINYYCNEKVSYTTKNNVAKFIYDNLTLLHLSTENILETQVNCLSYMDSYEKIRINKLLDLGNLYLLLEQNDIANKKFNIALNYSDEENIELNAEENIKLYIGLIKTCIWDAAKNRKDIEKWMVEVNTNFLTIPILSDEMLMYKLDYFLLGYQLYHSFSMTSKALEYSQKGIELVEEKDLYKFDMQKCGKMWRFHAIAVKEEFQNLKLCMEVFYKAKNKCLASAKFIFGYVIHENMTFNDSDYKTRLEKKLKNYELLENLQDKLSIDEYLHYKTNVAAIYFYLKDYDSAYDIYLTLLDKSVTFGIKRETMRILNDMANIDYIHGKLDMAERKYKRAIKIAEIAGYYHNCWPIYLNCLSFFINNEKFKEAYKLYTNIKKYNSFIMKKKESDILNYEEIETYSTALIIEMHCLCRLYNALKYSDLKEYICEIDIENQLLYGNEKIKSEQLIQQLEKTMFEHCSLTGEKLYLLKN